MTRTAVYTGTFDPLTLGHLDIVTRAMRLCDRLVIGIGANSSKAPLFTRQQRVDMVKRETAGLGAIEVCPFDGLAIDFARAQSAELIVRGLRNAMDFDYEGQMAAMNRMMAGEVETIFLIAAPALAPIASSLVREVVRGGGDVTAFVTPGIAAEMRAWIAAS